jgi:hypothetical protein
VADESHGLHGRPEIPLRRKSVHLCYHVGLCDSASMREYMTTRNRDAPMPETSAGSSDDLRREYEDSKTTILGLRVETEEEGKERAKRLARRTPTVRDVEELDVVRFVSKAAETEVRFYLETAIDWIPDLDAMFEAEVPTLQFLASWGAFQLYYGILMASYLSSGALRTAVKGGEALRLSRRRRRDRPAAACSAR